MARHSLLQSWKVAFLGFLRAVRVERNVRIVLLCMVIAIVLSIYLRISLWEWYLVVLCSGLVLTTELLNTAIEAVTDLACEKQHPLAALAKDTAAAATFAASVTSLVIGLIVFLPKIVELIW